MGVTLVARDLDVVLFWFVARVGVERVESGDGSFCCIDLDWIVKAYVMGLELCTCLDLLSWLTYLDRMLEHTFCVLVCVSLSLSLLVVFPSVLSHLCVCDKKLVGAWQPPPSYTARQTISASSDCLDSVRWRDKLKHGDEMS